MSEFDTFVNTAAGRAAAEPGAFHDAWVPVRRLAQRHEARILAHLLALDERDRYLRFGYSASDAHIEHYARSIDFGRDEVLGVFNGRLELVAMAHLAMPKELASPDAAAWAEFGVSVLRRERGRGLGQRLFDHAVLHARNRGIEDVVIHALSENAAMLKIARKAGAIVQRDGSESQARLKLPPDDLISHVDEVIEQQVAELDYELKRQTRRIESFLQSLARAPNNRP